MNLIDWRKNPERRSLSLDMLNQPTMREMIAVMELEHPAKQRRAIADGFGATRVLGQIEGFQDALNMLRSFAEPLPTAPDSIPVTWGVDDEPDLPTK